MTLKKDHKLLPTSPYPKPGPRGGRLIRQVIAFLRSQECVLPYSSHILIGVSGGIDSVGLAHLLIHYGRRIVPLKQITLIHINHRWRAEESDQDEDFVRRLSKKWGVPLITRRLKPPLASSGKSWEEEARESRKKIFKIEGKKKKALVLTAHHLDDLAETVIWRLFTGAIETHGGGILFQHGVELRPFLQVRKMEIQDYLKEVGQDYREDSTNVSERFLRARMRLRLMPEIENLFPRAIQHLGTFALQSQKANPSLSAPSESSLIDFLFDATGLKLRRAHFNLIKKKGVLDLPGGWRLVRNVQNYKKTRLPQR